MLYTYQYIHKHKIHELNKHLLIFFRRIKNVKSSSKFVLETYFHKDFITVIEGTQLEVQFRTFFNTYKKLSANNKNLFYNVIIDSQSIQYLFEDISIDCNRFSNTELEKIIGHSSMLKNLMSTLYKSMSAKNGHWKIYDHYSNIYNGRKSPKVCPFCGVELLHSSFREDYDHLAPKGVYPLFSINMRNLAPMCTFCNEKCKGEKDVFYEDRNKTKRRRFAYPYNMMVEIALDYSESILPETDYKYPEGYWKIKFNPDIDYVKTWLDIFQIENRYVTDYIIPNYFEWLDQFIFTISDKELIINEKNLLRTELSRYSNRLFKQPFLDTNIIKAPLFKYFADCENESFYTSLLRRIKTKISA
ncbi:MAG: hypothetical protein PHS59_00340 [Paludibacter sp.]|nr:hypothetical protein [Paludibacter sp.]